MSWLIKYKPNNIEEIYGNEENKKLSEEWLVNYDLNKNKKRLLFISGISGIGKTSYIKLLLKKYNYNYICYDSYDFKSKKSLECEIKKILNSKNIISLFSDNGKKKAIFIDNIDTIVNNDKGALNKILALFKDKKKKDLNISIPIIFVSSGTNERKLTDLKKISTVISFDRVSIDDYMSFIQNIIKNENIEIEDTLLKDLYEFSDYNLRIVILNIMELYKLYGNNEITDDMYESFKGKMSYRQMNINLFHSLHNILNNYIDTEYNINVYNCDRSLLPMMIFENYITYLDKRCEDNKKKMLCMNTILQSIIESDNIDYQIYNYQLWFLQNYNCINYCCKTSFEINKISKNTSSYDIEFTHLLSKSALQYFNYQNFVFFKNILELDKDNCLYIVNLILKIIFSEDKDNTVNYIKHFVEKEPDFVYKCIKMVKLCSKTDYKNKYTNPFKNNLLTMCKNS